MKHYSTIDRVLTALMILSIAFALAMAGLNIWQDAEARRIAWENSIPMCNQHITWEGAGYQKIVLPKE